MRRTAFAVAYALGNLLRNLRAGARLACFLRVDRLSFRIDLAQVVLLFAVSALIDCAGDWFHAAPPREFALEGVGSELYSGALLLLASALIAIVSRQRQLALALPVIVLSSLPLVQVLHYVASGLALHPNIAELVLVIEYLLLVWVVLVLVRCVAVAFAPPPSFVWLRAIGGGLLLATPIWFGNALIANQPWWRGAADEPIVPGEFHAGSEAVLAAQTYLLDSVLDKLTDQRPGDTDLYFVGFAPYGRQDDYRKELEAAQHVMDARWGSDGRSMLLINSSRTLITTPFATVTNLREVLDEIGSIIDAEDDVVMLYLTSATARNGKLAAEQPPLSLVELGPAGLKQLLDDAGIKWRIIVVSACYSGVFVEPLADEYTLIVTDAKAGQASFGCDGRTPPTFFGDAFFQQGLGKSASFGAAFDAAKARVAQREREAGYAPASEPQWAMGAAMAEKLKSVRKRGAGGATVQGVPALPRG